MVVSKGSCGTKALMFETQEDSQRIVCLFLFFKTNWSSVFGDSIFMNVLIF